MTAGFMMAGLATPCHHKQAQHVCGTHARYVLDKCRCGACRRANTDYEKVRRQWTGEFPKVPPPLIDSGQVREHVLGLMAQGMGQKRIAKVAGVPSSAVGSIVWGRHDRKATRVRRKTAERLLAVELDLADGHPVDGSEARAIIAELKARGWTGAAIGRRVHGPHAASLQVARGMVFVSTLRTLRGLLDEDVPLRVHNPTGKTYTPKGRAPRPVAETTPGVPSVWRVGSPVWLAAMRAGLQDAYERSLEAAA